MRIIILFISLLIGFQPAIAAEGNAFKSDISQARLLPHTEAVRLGEAFTVALELRLAPGWHTYADPPGDAGLPVTIEWELPPGFAASGINWPPPTTFKEGEFTTNGYAGAVSLPVTITPSSSPPANVALKAHASWLACKDICIPESATLTLALPVAGAAAGGGGLAYALLLALAGGLLLNLMPCVLPVLTLKCIAVAKQHHLSTRQARREGIAYTLGILLCFGLLAAALLIFKAGGEAVGWGFQMQSPAFVGAMAALMFGMGLSMSGFIRLPNVGGHARGSFMTGMLAALVAAPCTAPFMAAAVGYALTLGAAEALLVFEALGFGLALPFLLISFIPALRAFLPKPGAWMLRLKHWLAVPMYATGVWLLWVLMVQLAPPPATSDFNVERIETLRAEGKGVFVDVTAAWCITCQVNERTTLKSERVQALFAQRNITWLVADWTRRDAGITAYLASFGRQGVPMYVYYPPRGEPKLLPQLLTPEVVTEAVAP